MADDGPAGAAPPRAGDLLAVATDDWVWLLQEMRPVLNDLDESEVTPRIARLRSTPTVKLSGGRSRQDLAEVLAGGGTLWLDLLERLREGVPDSLSWLVQGRRPAAAPPPPAAARPVEAAPDPEHGEEVRRLRDRARELQDERDRALRQVLGAEVRLESAEEELAALRAELRGANERIGELERERDDAAQQVERAVERERRRGQSRIAELEEQLRRYRRADQQRREREQRHRRAQEAADRQTVQRDADADAPGAVVAGRPTRLPPGVVAGTAEATRLLLRAHRRLIVDGYNVTRKHRGHVGFDDQRAWLVRLLDGLAARTRLDIEVVFDSSDGPARASTSAGGVRVRFAPGDITADDDIAFAVAALPEQQPVLVVTDDGGLASRVEEHGADVVGTRPFLSVAE